MKELSGETPNVLQEIIFKKKYRVLRHVLFWLFIYLDEFLGFFGLSEMAEMSLPLFSLEILADLTLVYINIYLLLPRFFMKGKLFTYLLLTLITVLIVVAFNGYIYGDSLDDLYFGSYVYDEDFERYHFGSYLISGILTHVSLISLAVAMKFIQKSFKSNKQIKDLREENLKTELAYLKTQVNPHFLFNTLNNIYVMAQKKDENVPDTVLHLADLLRYQLYDCEEETVSLHKEVGYLNNYVDLEKLRRQNLDVSFDVSSDVKAYAIRPLILLPFVENAFKYSNTGGIGRAYINISIEVVKDELRFNCKNNIGSLKASEVGGIGLTNATRRLELAYPNAHNLEITESDNTFSVSLNLRSI